MEAMEKDGSLVAGSRTEIGRATSGFAVRAGAPTPDVSTPDAMKKTLLAARTVAYVDPAGGGTTGVFFAGLLTRLGIADEINRKRSGRNAAPRSRRPSPTAAPRSATPT